MAGTPTNDQRTKKSLKDLDPTVIGGPGGLQASCLPRSCSPPHRPRDLPSNGPVSITHQNNRCNLYRGLSDELEARLNDAGMLQDADSEYS